MSKGKTKLSIPILLVMATLVFTQGSGYLSQKLMVENDIRKRVKEALSKVIDSHKYVINVDVDLEVMDEVNEQITVFAPREKSKTEKRDVSPAEKTAEALVKIQDRILNESPSEQESYSIGLPIPGFEVDVAQPKAIESDRPLTESRPIAPKTMKPMGDPAEEDVEVEKEVVDKVLSRKRPARAVIKRMDLSLILQEGAAPELIENIRQLAMTASKFDRERGDKLTIMTASFKERRDQRSAEQIMLKNIAEKIDKLEEKRVTESTNWRDDIETYKEEISLRREEDLKKYESQLQELDKKRLQEAAEYEKRELSRKDSIRNSKLQTEIEALKEMLSVKELQEQEKAEKLDSSRFAMLDNELQSLRKMWLQAMLRDSIDAQKQAENQIKAELSAREREKASRDSLIAEKIAALDAVQADLDALEAEAASGMDIQTIMLIASGVVIVGLLVMVVLQRKAAPQQSYPPMPPYPPYPPPRRRKRRKKPSEKKELPKEQKPEPAVVEPKVEEPESTLDETEAEASPNGQEQVEAGANGDLSEENGGETVSLHDDPNVLKSEIDDIRKSIVSMSVGQPGRTSTIVKEWLEQPAPETAATTSDDASSNESEEAGDGDGEEAGDE